MQANFNVMKEKDREKSIYRVTLAGSAVNVVLLVFKFVAGFLGGSAAMIADAVHSLSDFITDVIVLLFVKLSSKPEDSDHDYGHGKYETLATSLIGLALMFVGIMILYNGVCSIASAIMGSPLPQPGMIALAAALVSIALKEWAYRFTVKVGRECESQAVIANAWHHRSDALSSIGTAIGIGGALALGSHWTILDPIAALIVSVLIIHASIEQLRPSLGELVENSLPEPVEEDIIKTLLSFDGVKDPHNLRTRKIGNRSSIEVHVRMDGHMTLDKAHDITRAMEKKLKEQLGEGTFVIIHVEPIK